MGRPDRRPPPRPPPRRTAVQLAAGMIGRLAVAGGALALAVVVAGCGIGASHEVVTFPPQSVGPAATVSPAVLQTRALIAAALAPLQIQLGDAKDPYRPGESARVASAPRAVYQAVLP